MTKQTLPSVEELTRLITDATMSSCHPSIIQRLTVLRYFVEHRPTVLELCRHFGISRSTFHRWLERFDPLDPRSLLDHSHDSHSDHSQTVPAEAIELIRRYRHESPLLGKERIATMLRQQHGIIVSPSTVGRIIDRECLYFAETPLHWKKRVEHGIGDAGPAQASPMPMEVETADPISEVATNDASNRTSSNLSPVVHVHVPEMNAPRAAFSGVIKFIAVTSLLINIVFISMLVGIALFERSTRSISPRMDATTIPAPDQSIQGLHGAPSTVYFP